MNDEQDVPPVVPGSTVLIQLKGRTVRSAETGEIIEHIPSAPTPMVVHDRDECVPDNWAEEYNTREEAMHTQTICPECIHSWAIDWYIDFPTTIPPKFGGEE